ncbi:DUF885 domain-containing protein [Novosphingopyxis baekryungensis]|uniref:DUF885 domain-containing protein n=1 Tax=Novosphingopyxis baekryungensis TaxID=279369 RepID=UPI0003B73454|nr:DUF885 domain-containing protein [Novosphingopyxis baekryungensis]
MRNLFGSIAAAALVVSLQAPLAAQQSSDALAAEPNQDQAILNDVMDGYWAYVLEQNPVLASSVGVDDYAGQVGDYSLEAADRQAAQAQRFLDRLKTIDPSALDDNGQVNLAILQRMLGEQIESNRFGQRVVNFTSYSSWHQNFAGMANNLPFRTKADYRSYIDRLAQFPAINAQSIAVANQAIAGGYTQHCVTLQGFEGTITGLITEDPAESRFYEPFTRPRPSTISEAEFAALGREAAEVIQAKIYPALAEQRDWYVRDYAPACAQEIGVSAQPGGTDYYAFRIREMTTTDMSADEIHQLGLTEVARIRSEMETVAKAAGYASREAFIAHLRTDPQYYADDAETLMEKNARQAKTIDGKLPGLFGRLPRLPYGLRAIPAETAEGTTTASYNPGSPEIGVSGTYYVNTSKLDQRPYWEIPALTAHESVPGHHLQIALQQELDMPEFRKQLAFFTAFVEGWGLYSERLGIEMGIYDTAAKDMGRLSYEMWRACRLVVDTGIHSKGWSKDRAVAFMTDNSALTAANIDAEVNRYISWPGQALAYKIGELKIRALRTRAEEALGDRFDLRAFHDVVLGQGAVPLDLLERRIASWIAQEQQAS